MEYFLIVYPVLQEDHHVKMPFRYCLPPAGPDVTDIEGCVRNLDRLELLEFPQQNTPILCLPVILYQVLLIPA